MFWRKGDGADGLPRLDGSDDLERALEAPLAVLYKHSSLCGTSSWAVREVVQFAANHPTVPTYLIDVIGNRELSDQIERELGVRHETPQVILLETGVPRWTTSHAGVTTDALTEQLRLRDG